MASPAERAKHRTLIKAILFAGAIAGLRARPLQRRRGCGPAVAAAAGFEAETFAAFTSLLSTEEQDELMP